MNLAFEDATDRFTNVLDSMAMSSGSRMHGCPKAPFCQLTMLCIESPTFREVQGHQMLVPAALC